MAVFEETGKGNISRIRGKLVFEYESEEMAKAIFESIKVDNYQYVKCRVEKEKIICEAESIKASKLLHTLDDLISCVIVAEEVYRRA